VVVYSSFEAGVLSELASALPDLASGLDALRARLVDLLPVMRQHVYHPAFGGSFSLKAVAPALVEGFGYGDLEQIAGGGEASAAFLRLASGAVADPEEEARLRSALRAYCKRDTLALVELHRVLRARTGV
jgi:predicted RecB family nuclease